MDAKLVLDSSLICRTWKRRIPGSISGFVRTEAKV
jgi:hypothetical protein